VSTRMKLDQFGLFHLSFMSEGSTSCYEDLHASNDELLSPLTTSYKGSVSGKGLEHPKCKRLNFKVSNVFKHAIN
jgi:hypothetical protein